MNTSEQNYQTILDLNQVMGYDEVGNLIILKEVLLWLDSSTKISMYKDICNLWDIDEVEELPQETLLLEVFHYLPAGYMQEILDDIKNLWI